MKKTLLLQLLCFTAYLVSAQNSEDIVIKPGEEGEKTLLKVIYLYPDFHNGFVYLKDGKKSAARLNYNIYNDKIEFISPIGDTLEATDEKNFDHIVIAKDTLYYQQGYFQKIGGNDTVKLVVKQSFAATSKEKIGGYGISTSTAAVTPYNSVSVGNQRYNLTVNEIVTLKKENIFYIGDQFNHFQKATRKNI